MSSAMRAQRTRAPSLVCVCGHSCQWHEQSAATLKEGARSFVGASCLFPGCACRCMQRGPMVTGSIAGSERRR